MSRFFTASAALAGALLLGGCAGISTVSSNVSSFGEWPADRKPGTYAFERLPSQQARAAESDVLESSDKSDKANLRIPNRDDIPGTPLVAVPPNDCCVASVPQAIVLVPTHRAELDSSHHIRSEFVPMAQTVAFALLGAFILSLTYIPMMSSIFLSKKIGVKEPCDKYSYVVVIYVSYCALFFFHFFAVDSSTFAILLTPPLCHERQNRKIHPYLSLTSEKQLCTCTLASFQS